MLRRVLPLFILLTAAFGAAFITGCGSDSSLGGSGNADAAGSSNGEMVKFDLGTAADATAAKGSAQFGLNLIVSGAGLKEPTTITATGGVDGKNKKANITLDLGKALEAAGAPAGGDNSVEVRVDGKKFWVKVPQVPGMSLPDNKKWVTVDIDKLVKKFGGKITEKPSKEDMGKAGTLEMKKVGTEQLDGADVTHLSGKFTGREIVAALPGGQSKAAADAIKKAEESGGDEAKKALDNKYPVDIWVDNDNVIHRMTADVKIDGKSANDSWRVKIDVHLAKFGSPVTVQAPPDSQVLDVTALILQFADGFKSSMGKTS